MSRPHGAVGALDALITASLADAEATWSLGGFGALAEFARTSDEPVVAVAGSRAGLVTARGAIALDPGAAIPVAYETAFAGGWSHAVALCLPRTRCPGAEGGVLTEQGADEEAVRPQNSGDNLFDLGLGLPQGRVGLRSADPDTCALLRRAEGLSALDPAGPVLDLIARRAIDLVVSTPLGRIEVFAGAASVAPGPRGFLAPRVLALGRTHAATASIPEGLVPVATLHPAHPCRDANSQPRAFDPGRHARFQALYRRWGDRDLVALKDRLADGATLDAPSANRWTRNVARVVRAQAAAMAPVRDA